MKLPFFFLGRDLVFFFFFLGQHRVFIFLVRILFSFFFCRKRVFFLLFLNLNFFLVESVFSFLFSLNLSFINSHLRMSYHLDPIVCSASIGQKLLPDWYLVLIYLSKTLYVQKNFLNTLKTKHLLSERYIYQVK